jgi:hypothetical protein
VILNNFKIISVAENSFPSHEAQASDAPELISPIREAVVVESSSGVNATTVATQPRSALAATKPSAPSSTACKSKDGIYVCE